MVSPILSQGRLGRITCEPNQNTRTQQNTSSLLPSFYQCNLDVQDQFLNFELHRLLWEHSSVNV